MLSPGGATGRVLEVIAAAFEQQTGTRIEYAELGTNEAIEQQILGLSSGSRQFDVVVVESGYLNAMIRGLEPLNQRVESDPDVSEDVYVPAMADLFRQDANLYAMPFRVGGRILMYNKALLAEAGYDGPPQTAAEFLDMARATTGNGVFGYAATLQQGNFLVTQWTPWLRSFGSDLLDDQLRCAAFNDADGQAATQFFVDLYRQHQVISPDAISWENDALITDMQAGRSAMALGFSGWLGEIIDPEVSKVTTDIAVAPNLPHGPNADHGVTDLGGWGLGVNAAIDDARKDAVWQFAKFATSPENQLRFALEAGNTPTVGSVFEDPEYLKLVPEAANMLSTFETGVRQRPAVDNYGEIEQALARSLSQALIGDITVPDALNTAQTEVNALLGGNCQ